MSKEIKVKVTLVKAHDYCLACGGEVYRRRKHYCWGALGKLVRFTMKRGRSYAKRVGYKYSSS